MTAQETLQKYWQYDAFRPLQEDVVNAVLQGNDTLALMPTGGGKSICFQVPAMMMPGVCIVITPLIALMKDQVEQLQRRGIKAAAIYSGMRFREIDSVLDDFVYNEEMKFLYVSPERLHSEIMIERTKRMKVGLLVVDEAHCVSQWGFDFRPAYLRIAKFRELLPKIPLIALTATATKDVQVDILSQLQMPKAVVFMQSFVRQNLSYSAFFEEDKDRKLFDILSKVGGSGIVYVKNRRRTKTISDWLNASGIKADFYHAGLDTQTRFRKQEDWIKNKTRIIVSTNAFGMGIDKPDVRVVVHLDPPETLEAYYQEAGRAGRDGNKAYTVLLFNRIDLEELQENILKKYPTLDIIRATYRALANYYRLAVGSHPFESFDFDLQEFLSTFGLNANDVHYSLKILEDEGYIHLNDAYYSPSRFMFETDGRGLYDFQLRNPTYDQFTKLLLRIYGGELYSNMSQISETNIARQFYATPYEVEKMLEYLTTSKIGLYEKQRSKPQLSYLLPRHDADTLPIDTKGLAKRKNRDLEKVAATIFYAQEKRRCRMQLLSEYFDEINNNDCGVCDNCLSKKKQATPQSDLERYRKLIINHLLSNPDTVLTEFVAQNQTLDQEILKEVLQKLIDNEIISYQKGGIIRLK
jgi:ATP-dependent DNA helicase RecQ